MKPEKTALILIDIQKDFWKPLKKHPENKQFPQKVAQLLEYARNQKITVIHVRSIFKADRSDWMLFYRPEERGTIPCIEGTPGTAFTSFAEPKTGETIIEKQVFDTFKKPQLAEFLQTKNLDTILLAGLETSVCVLFTATSGYQLQYLPIIVTDACADSPKRHNNVIEMYTDLCFKTTTVEQLIEKPKK